MQLCCLRNHDLGHATGACVPPKVLPSTLVYSPASIAARFALARTELLPAVLHGMLRLTPASHPGFRCPTGTLPVPGLVHTPGIGAGAPSTAASLPCHHPTR